MKLLAAFICLGLGGGAGGAIQKIPNARSAFGPSLTVVNDILCAAWRGPASPNSPEDDQQVYLAFYRRGQWQPPIILPARSMFSPALAADGGTLYVAWHPEGNLFTGTGGEGVLLGAYEDGKPFRHLGTIPRAMSAGPPSLAFYRGLLYASWRGRGNITVGMVPGNEHWISYATYDSGARRWSTQDASPFGIVHANSTSGASLAVANDRLHALWRGTGSLTFMGPNSDPGDPLTYYSFFDGDSWSAYNLPLPTVPGAATAWGAAAADWGGELCIGWRGDQPWDGARGDQTLYFARLDNDAAWKPLELFPAPKPASAFGPSMTSSGGGDELWVAWRGIFDSVREIDDQSIYVASVARRR